MQRVKMPKEVGLANMEPQSSRYMRHDHAKKTTNQDLL